VPADSGGGIFGLTLEEAAGWEDS